MNSIPTSVASTLGRIGLSCISTITGTKNRTTTETFPAPRMGLVVARIPAPKNPRTPRWTRKVTSTSTTPSGGRSKLLGIKLIHSLHEDNFDISKPKKGELGSVRLLGSIIFHDPSSDWPNSATDIFMLWTSL